MDRVSSLSRDAFRWFAASQKGDMTAALPVLLAGHAAWISRDASCTAVPNVLTISNRPAALHDRLAEPGIVAALIVGWLILHAILRLMIGPTLGMDDAEQALAAQSWSLGYRTEQPPLFTWLLLLLKPLFGVGYVPITVLRYTFLGLFCFSFWHAAKAWLGDNGRAAMATLSLPTFYTFGWYAQVDLTHSTVLATAAAILLWLAARILQRPRIMDYLLFGVALGLGMLGKWNLAMAGAALMLTGLILPEGRRAILHPGTVAAALVAFMIVLPNAWWLLNHKSFEAAGNAVLIRGQKSRTKSLLDLVVAALAFAQPWLILALIVFFPGLRRRRPLLKLSPAIRFLGTYTVVALALHALLVLPFGGVDFSERWMIVPLLPLPILLAALLDPHDLPLARWVFVVAVAVLLALGLRAGMQLAGGDRCPGRCRIMAPFTAFARQLREVGFANGTVAVDDLHLGGNLRARFPLARVVDVDAPVGVFGPPTGQGQCLLAWNADLFGHKPPEALIADAADKLEINPNAPAKRGEISALLSGASQKRQSIGYVLFDAANGLCR